MSNRRNGVALVTVCMAVCLAPLLALAAGDGAGTYRLSLAEALRIALENNLDLVSARYAPDLAEQDITVQDSDFDPGFEATGTMDETKRAATQLSTVTGSRSQSANAGVGQTLSMGLDYSVGFGMTRAEQTGPNVVAPVSYFSGFNLGFTLPLLKGFGSQVNTEQLVLARNAWDVSITDLEGQAETVLESVEGAYWNVVAARAALDVARQALGRAEDLLELNRKKVEVGTLAPIEITQAQAGVASQEEGVIVAEVTLWDAEDELRRLLAIPEHDPIWEQEIVNTDLPDFSPREVNLVDSIEVALASRPEMMRARQTVRDRELNEKVAKRNVRHQLDLIGGYDPSGASLDVPNLSPPPELVTQGNLQDSLATIGDQYNWNAQLLYRVPFGNRAARAGFAKARLSREKSEVDLQNQSQTIRVEVRRAARAVESGQKRIEAAQVNVTLQRKKLEAEQKKFENGMSTSFEVLTFQNDLADAELSEIRARLDYIKGLASLERAQGTLLESRGLSIAPR